MDDRDVTGLRDYEAWHHGYDDPDSGLSWRLRSVRAWIGRALDEQPGPFRVISVCSGDARDILGVLAGRDDADRVTATLIELDETISDRAATTAAELGLSKVRVRRADAGISDSYADLEPADLVLLVGIFGNIGDDDIHRTIGWARQLCVPGGTVVWSRGRERRDLNPQIRTWFTEAGFREIDYAELDFDRQPALGAARMQGETMVPLAPGRRIFTFTR